MEGLHELLGLNLNNASRKVYLNPGSDFLIKKSVEMGHGVLAKNGALVVKTGQHTGRAAKDKYVVMNAASKEKIWWENNINVMTPENFLKLKNKVIKYLNEDRDLFIAENSVGAHPKLNMGVRVVTERPASALFCSYLFRKMERPFTKKDFHVLHAPLLDINPEEFGAKSKTVIVTCFETNTTIIIGTLYAGEIKKSMFSVLNFVVPDVGTFPMHAGANEGPNGDVSLFFGLSGTGKTTLSTDEDRKLIGDDEHGLSDDGVFNFEGGCYAKTYKLSKENEPDIWEATNRPGALLENVTLDPTTGELDFNDKTLSENGRSSYPLDFIKNIKPSATGGIPKNIFFLSADAFGCLPPVAKLNKKQAMYYFVLGYTAKLAGTEIGVVEPSATFSPCFGAPFMIRHPSVYAKLLGHYIEKYNIQVWLINTGWSGGPYGVGERFPIKITRQIIRSIQKTGLKDFVMKKDPIFGLESPQDIPGVDSSALNPRNTWKSGDEYDKKATELAKSFEAAMSKFGNIF
jgi:phosphoenolpyruvate carboxykinase (ATP)